MGWGKCVEGGVEVSLGGWCVGGAGEQDGPESMVKVYMSCVVSTPQTPVLDSSDQL